MLFEDEEEVSTPVRIAPVQWVGGKSKMKATILPLIPYTQTYVEPFGGAGSIIYARRPSPVEVYNDLDCRLVNLFRCFQSDKTSKPLFEMIRNTLYSKEEFQKAIEIIKGPIPNGKPDITCAWAFYLVCNQAFSGKIADSKGNWGREIKTSNGGMASSVSGWVARAKQLENWKQRIMRVQIDNRDGIEVVKYYDTPDTTFYLDPPYVLDTRVSMKVYANEPDAKYHKELVATLIEAKGAVVLSGYQNPIYVDLVNAGWSMLSHDTSCHAAVRTRTSGLQGKGKAGDKVQRVECVWRNEKAVELVERCSDLFSYAEAKEEEDDGGIF